MAIAFEAVSSTMSPSSAGEVTISNTLARTAATNFIVAYGASRVRGATAMTYNGVSMTQAVLENSSGSTTTNDISGIGLYYMFSSDLPGSTGSFTLEATFDTTGETAAFVHGLALSGVAQTTDGHVTASISQTATSSTSLSVTITPNEADSWLINAIYMRQGSTVAVGIAGDAAQTLRISSTGETSSGVGAAASILATQQPDSTASSTSVTFTFATGTATMYGSVAVLAVAPAPPGPSASPSASPSVSPSASPSIAPNESPTVALNSPADSATGVSVNPEFQFTGSDAESDDIEYQIQVDTVNTFDSQSS